MTENQDKLVLGDQYFVNYYQPSFGEYEPRHERLHPEDRQEKPHYALTETQYFGFFVPEAQIHCFTWIWHHPNLNSVQGGTMAWKGIKPISLGCELFDLRGHMDGSVLNDFRTYTLDSHLTVSHADPFQFTLKYDDPERDNHFEVVQQGVSEVLMWPSNKHFEQVMKCEGSITLRGETHKVDCYSVRDRSWGEYRLEDPMAIPPNSWVTGVFGEDFSFLVTCMDDPALSPIWCDDFTVNAKSLLRFGWMVVDGDKVAVRSARSLTEYEKDTLLPTAMRLEIEDERGRNYELTGRVTAATPLTNWLNVRVPICLIEWQCNGRKGIGEIQMAQFTDFIYRTNYRKK